MHWRTYYRIVEQILAHERTILSGAAVHLAALEKSMAKLPKGQPRKAAASQALSEHTQAPQ
jgi:hypothetical protein